MRHCSLNGVPFHSEVGAFLSAAQVRYPQLKSHVWLTAKAMAAHAISFTTATPVRLPLDMRSPVVLAKLGNNVPHASGRGMPPLRDRFVPLGHNVQASPTVHDGSDVDDGNSAMGPITVFNAAETTYVSAAAYAIALPCPPPRALAAASVFGTHWPPHVGRQLTRMESNGGDGWWVTPNQSKWLFQVTWSDEALEAAVRCGIARSVCLSPSHACQTPLIHVPEHRVEVNPIGAPASVSSSITRKEDAFPRIQADVSSRIARLSQQLRHPWVRTPLSMTCNAMGQRYAFTTAVALRAHLLRSMSEQMPSAPHRTAPADEVSAPLFGLGRNRQSNVATRRLQSALTDPVLARTFHRWATLNTLQAANIAPLPHTRPATIFIERSPLELYNVALTDIVLDPQVLACHPLLRDQQEDPLLCADAREERLLASYQGGNNAKRDTVVSEALLHAML